MPFLITSLVILLASIIARGPLTRVIATSSHPEPLFWIRDVACVLLASAIICLALETWNDEMSQVIFMYARHEFIIVLVVMTGCYLLAFRGGTLMALASVVATLIGGAQHYVWKFRGTPILPTDVSASALTTAQEVSGGYDLTPDDTILMTIAFGILAMAVSLLVRRPKGDGYLRHVLNVARSIRDGFVGAPGSNPIPTTGGSQPEREASADSSDDQTSTDAPADIQADEQGEQGATSHGGNGIEGEPATDSQMRQIPDGEDEVPSHETNGGSDGQEPSHETNDGSDGQELGASVACSEDNGDEKVSEGEADDGDIVVIMDDDAVEPAASLDGFGDDGEVTVEASDSEDEGSPQESEESDRTVAEFKRHEPTFAGNPDGTPCNESVETPYRSTLRCGTLRAKRLAACLCSPLLTILIAYAVISGGMFLASFDYEKEFPNMTVSWWSVTSSYRNQATLPTFAMLVQTTKTKEPRGWNESQAKAEYRKLVDSYEGTGKEAPTGADMPDIIGIMNESFCDMTIFERLELPRSASPRFMRLDCPEGVIECGRMRVSVFGGMTANSEYEFLTGDSLIGLGMSNIPFATYNLSKVPSLAKQLSKLGYGTYAIHPCNEQNWDRNSRYPELGFDRFISEKDFHEAGLDEEFHGAISDAMCYEMAKSVLDKREATGQPTFIWDVTVQNHGGYDQGKLPEEDLVNWDLSKLSENSANQLREYMSCIQNTTDATLALLDELENRERPTIVAFYGDHQPACTGMVVGELYDDLDDSSVTSLEYQTCYFIWENKAMRELTGRSVPEAEEGLSETDTEELEDTEGEDPENQGEQDGTEEPEDSEEVWIRWRDEIGTNTLAAHILEEIGYPLTDFQKAVTSIRQQEARSMCGMGMVDLQYRWFPTQERDMPSALRKLRSIDWLVVDRHLL